MIAGKYIAYDVLASISVVASVFVLASLIRLGSFKSSFTMLLVSLHVSLIMEIITILPYAYTSSNSLCTTIGVVHDYFSLMNILVVALLVEAHRSMVLRDFFGSRYLILKYGLYFIILFPMIILLALIGDRMTPKPGTTNGPWCALSFENSTWSLVLYSMWIWIFLCWSILSTLYTGWRISQSDHLLAKKFFSSIGLYVLIAVNSWLPRAIEKAIVYTHPGMTTNHFLSSYPYVVSGILYAVVYLRERKQLGIFTENTEFADNRSSFSWEHEDLSFLHRSMQHSSSHWSTDSFNPFLNLFPRPTSIEMPEHKLHDSGSA